MCGCAGYVIVQTALQHPPKPKENPNMKSFLFANVPLSVVHFILFVLFGGFLGWPGTVLAGALGAANGSVLWWAVMVLNSLVWGAVISIFVTPFLRKLLG